MIRKPLAVESSADAYDGEKKNKPSRGYVHANGPGIAVRALLSMFYHNTTYS
jgi:hypothetical protein